MRKKLMAANWKMYKTPDQTRDFFRDFLPLISDHTRDEIAICPPFVCVPAAVDAAKESNIAIGGQNLHWEKEGAYTGEVSAGILLATGCTHVIIGHSERRQYFGETDDTVNLKLKTALEAGLTPIVCVGEVLEEREAGLTTPQLAAEAHVLIRGEAAKAFGDKMAESLRILYGGSVKPENAKSLMSEEEIDGALVGGASLSATSFAAIIKY